MSWVQVSNVSLAFGERVLFEEANLSLEKGSRAALAGANGSGKTTLLKIIAGQIKPDTGSVIRRKDSRISYLPQSGIIHEHNTLYQEAEQAFQYWHDLSKEIENIYSKLETVQEGNPQAGPLLEELHALQEQVERSGFYRREERIYSVLTGLGFSPEDFSRATEEFSGGWQMRIALAKVLLEDPDILLLDEPTNYLDIEARNWLEKYLSTFSGGVLVVSHDKYFLDVTVSEVYEIFNRRITRYTGNYSAYEQRRVVEMESLLKAYREQQEEISRQEEFIRRFRYNASKAALVQSRIKQLEKIPRIEVPETLKKIHFRFPSPPPCGRKVLTVEALSKSYGDLQVFENLSFVLERGEKLAVVGHNGAGKSTLLRILAGKDTPTAGEVQWGSGVIRGYFSQEQEETLNPEHSILEEVETECPTSLYPKIRDMLGAFLFRGDEIYKPISVLSGGERNRLSLLKLLLRPANVLILDEPTNHLDMTSKDVLLEALTAYPGTVIFVSHDRYFMDGLARRILELRLSLAPRIFPGNYTYYLEKTEGTTTSEPLSEKPDISRNPSKSAERFEESKKRKAEARRLERRLEEILNRIDALENEHHNLQDQLSLPEIYRNGEQVKQLKLQIEENEKEQNALHQEWEKVDRELQSLEKALLAMKNSLY